MKAVFHIFAVIRSSKLSDARPSLVNVDNNKVESPRQASGAGQLVPEDIRQDRHRRRTELLR